MKFSILAALAWLILILGQNVYAGTVTYIYSDPQGTPLAEADANGNITATFDYRPYGVQALGSTPNGPGYTGHVNDSDTRLVYMQARYYDPELGRFFSVDPAGIAAGNLFKFGRYAYANGNPIINFDPDGRQTVPMVEVTLRDGSTVRVPSNYAQNVILADDTGSSSSDYANPNINREQAASGLDDISLGAGVLAVSTVGTPAAPVAAFAGIVDESAAVLAFIVKPTKERATNVATAQAARAVKVAARLVKNERAVETVEAAERAKTVAEAAKRADEAQQKRREKQEEERRERQSQRNN